MQKKYLVPSFEVESKTQSFTIGIWAINALASLFTFWGVVIILPAMFSNGVLDLLGNVTHDWIFYSICGMVITALIDIYLSIVALHRLLVSYKLEEGKIVKGRIKRVAGIDRNSKELNEKVGGYLKRTIWLSNGDFNQKVMTSQAVDHWGTIFQLIHCNKNPQFVELFFDGTCYKKKEYFNPILIKETAKKMVYQCDNKKLTIYKMYSNMGINTPFNKHKSFGKRLIKTLVLTFVLALFVSVPVVCVDYSDTQNYLATIEPIKQQQVNEIKNTLKKYGYNQDSYAQDTFTRKDSIGSDCSVTYSFSRYTGEIKDIDLSLRIPLNYVEVYDEFDAIMAPIISKFDQENMNDFKNGITKIIAGDHAHNVLYSTDKEFTIRLKKSDGKIYIYSY